MLMRAHNDRTIRRHAGRPAPTVDLAFRQWLERQLRMLDRWENELIGQGGSDDTLVRLQAHKSHLRDIARQSGSAV